MEQKSIKKIVNAVPTTEGAGVHLKRVFGYHQVPLFDPFLLLDDFGSDHPDDYLAGFPWHPHRGIETVTYMLDGIVEHGDSLGNKGEITSGDVQWMTAGSGIIHQEMPQNRNGSSLRGVQLWVNLPSSQKMMVPRYRDIKQEMIPTVQPQKNTQIKILSGEIEGVKGPVQDIVVDIEYFDVSLKENTSYEKQIKSGYQVFAYILSGKGVVHAGENVSVQQHQAILFDAGETVKLTAQSEDFRYLLITGEPLNEPVAWSGPIVMNTKEELQTALREYREGTFIRDAV
jgi:hypothetical protein